MSLIDQLAERRQNIWHEAKGLLDAASAENRDLTAEETGKYEAMSADLTALRSRIDLIAKTEQENRDIEASLSSMVGAPGERSGPTPDLNAAFRALAKGETRSVEIGAQEMGPVWTRALSKGTATAGGNTVPTSFRDQLIEHLIESSGLMLLGPTVLNTTSGENIELPVTTSYGAAALVAEAGTLVGTDPAFAKRTLGAYKYGQLVKVSSELVADSAFDISAFIAKVAGRNVGLALAPHLITGTGSSQPTGVVTTATNGKTGGAGVTGAFTADDLIDLQYSVIAPYRNSPNAGWLMRDASMAAVRKLKDGASRYIFEPGLIGGAPDSILGKPVQTDPNVAAIALGAKSVLFGDWSQYFVRMAGGVRFERSDDFAFGTDEVAFRAIIRADALLADQTGAIKYFTGNAA